MRNYLAIRPALPSFQSEASDLVVHEWLPAGAGAAHAAPDMVAMARWAMHYLLYNPQPGRGYECRFVISPLDCPPARGDHEHDEIAPGDTESRMELEYVYMREMTGDSSGREVEAAIRQRILSYVRDDGLCWCSPRAAGGDDSTPAAMTWTTGYLLRSTAERYRLTGDEAFKALGYKLVAGLRRLATQRGGLLWYEGGMAGWRNGEWLLPCRNHYPTVVDPLVRFARVAGDEQVLAFAEAMAEGIVAGVQDSLERTRIQPDGSHSSGNCHLSMRTALGVAEVGAATGNARLVEWARRVYEFTRACGTDWGWYPENIITPEKRYWSETCVTGDAVECAVALAQAGYTEYWDHIERAVRNYLPEAQLFITPGFEAFYRKTHAARPAQDVEAGLRLLRRFEGGFLARQRPNDWVYRRDGRWQVNMMGCCPPEGMRALYAAWRHTVVEQDGSVYVNMALDRDAHAAQVIAGGPEQGRVRVIARRAGDFFLRPPAWAPLEAVRARVNGAEVAPQWKRQYVLFAGAQPGDTLDITYPVPQFTQMIPIGCERAEETYRVRWLGNHVEEVSPRGSFLPIFTGTRRAMPPLPAATDVPSVDVAGGPGLSDADWKPDA